MSLKMTCTNPECGKQMKYASGDFQVVCEFCGTWHLAADSDESGSSQSDSFTPEDLYIPEDNPMPFGESENILPDELDQEQLKEKTESKRITGNLVDAQGNIYPLSEGKNVIGRKGSDIIIKDPTVSRRHCVIEVTIQEEHGLQYHIYDIGFEEGAASTNGVFVSGRSQRLQDYEKIAISVGTTIKVGETSLKLKHTAPNP